jgi:hypothetical protein
MRALGELPTRIASRAARIVYASRTFVRLLNDDESYSRKNRRIFIAFTILPTQEK